MGIEHSKNQPETPVVNSTDIDDIFKQWRASDPEKHERDLNDRFPINACKERQARITGTECVICTDPITRANSVLLQCGHDYYCIDCLTNWLKSDCCLLGRARCPVCNATISHIVVVNQNNHEARLKRKELYTELSKSYQLGVVNLKNKIDIAPSAII